MIKLEMVQIRNGESALQLSDLETERLIGLVSIDDGSHVDANGKIWDVVESDNYPVTYEDVSSFFVRHFPNPYWDAPQKEDDDEDLMSKFKV